MKRLRRPSKRLLAPFGSPTVLFWLAGWNAGAGFQFALRGQWVAALCLFAGAVATLAAYHAVLTRIEMSQQVGKRMESLSVIPHRTDDGRLVAMATYHGNSTMIELPDDYDIDQDDGELIARLTVEWIKGLEG